MPVQHFESSPNCRYHKTRRNAKMRRSQDKIGEFASNGRRKTRKNQEEEGLYASEDNLKSRAPKKRVKKATKSGADGQWELKAICRAVHLTKAAHTITSSVLSQCKNEVRVGTAAAAVAFLEARGQQEVESAVCRQPAQKARLLQLAVLMWNGKKGRIDIRTRVKKITGR